MDLLNMLAEAGGKGSVREIAGKLGIGESESGNLISALAPALLRGIKNQASSDGGVEALSHALQSGHHQKYLDDPASLISDNGVTDGNKILGHLFGSKDVSRNVAAKAAESSGFDVGLLKKALPMIAGLAMGALSKKSDSGSSVGSVLPGLLGAAGDDDGFGLDDVLGMAKKFL